jgi:outer membrane receptor for ferrienterochelin and colicin
MNDKPHFAWLLAILVSEVSAQTNAHDHSAPITELDTMVVTATPGRSLAVKDVQASVEVITPQRLKSLSLRTLPQILQYAAGTGFVADSGTNSRINLRGSSNNQTLILVDGLRRTGKFGTTDLTGLSIENIQQIEIIRGPMSALYGADSIGGVINIITKAPGEQFGATGSFTWGQAERGQRDTFIERAGVSTGDFHGLKNRFSAEVFNKNALRADTTLPTTTLQDIDRYYVNYAGSFDFTPQRKLRWTGELMEQNDTGTAFNGGGRVENEDRKQISLTYDDAYDWGSARLLGTYGQTLANVGRNAQDPTDIEKTKYELGQIEGFLNWFAADNMTVTLGTGGRFQDIDISTFDRARFPGTQSRHVFHALSQIDWDIVSDVKLLAGVRYDSFSDFGDALNPRASLSWSPGDFNFRVGYGSAFKAPEFVNMFPTFVRTSLRGPFTSVSTINGNPNLKPEKSETLEMASKYSFDHENVYGSLEAIGHVTWYEDLIQSINTRNRTVGRVIFSDFNNFNTGQAKVRGAEIIFNLGVKEYYNLFASYEYLDAEDTKTKERLIDRARHSFRFQNTFHLHPQVDLSLNGRFYDGYVGTNANRVRESAYHHEFDAKLDYAATQWLTAFVGVDNVFNRVTPFVMGLQGTPNDPGGRFYYTGFNVSY